MSKPHQLSDIGRGISKTLFDRRSFFVFVLSTTGVFALLFLIPVWTTPGNSIAFQWSLLTKTTLALLISLSIVNGLVLGMHSYIKKHTPELAKGGHTKKATTFLGMIGSSLAATMACAACYSSVLALLGLGGTPFVVTHRWWFASFALLLSLVAIHFAAKKIVGGCKSCQTNVCPVSSKHS